MRWLLGLLASAVLIGCGGPQAQAVDVLAASSLTDALTAAAQAFEAANPDVDIALSFGPSQTLATQVIEGAPADVYASANTAQMDRVASAGLVDGQPLVIARNHLAIAVAVGNPEGVTGLDDLARDDLVLVLTSPDVPAGSLAAQVLRSAGLDVEPASLELNVRATLAKVELGEADAAIVYASDLATAGATVEGVTIPDDRNAVAEYPAAVLAGADPADDARAFLDFLQGPAGQQALVAAGFRPATGG